MPKIHLHWLYPNFHVPPYLGHAMEPGKQHPWLPTCSCAGWYLAGHLLQNAMWRSRFWTANCGDAGAPQPSSAIGLPGAVWGLAPARAWKRRSGHTALARYRLEGSLDRTDPTKAWQTPRRPGRKSTEKKRFHVAMGYITATSSSNHNSGTWRKLHLGTAFLASPAWPITIPDWVDALYTLYQR